MHCSNKNLLNACFTEHIFLTIGYIKTKKLEHICSKNFYSGDGGMRFRWSLTVVPCEWDVI